MRRWAFLGILAACGGGQTPAPDVEPPSSAALFLPNEAVAYTLESADGRVLGRVHSRYDASAGQRTVVTRIALGTPVTTTVEYATTLASDLSPTAFKRLSSSEGRMTLTFEANSVTRVTDLGTERLPPLSGALLPSDDPVLLALVIEKAEIHPGQTKKLSIFAPDAGAPTEWTVQVYADPERRTVVQLPFGKATLDARGQIAELVRPDGRRLRRVEPAGDPPALLPIPQLREYMRPSDASWLDKQIVIPVEGGQLAGVLSEPRLRAQWKKNLAPGIVFLSDLPPQNRHGYTGGADYGTWQIFDQLAEQGFAVLRVDDRGVGASSSTIPPERVTAELQIADARAMIDALRRQPAVDPEHIFLIGHGFGALDALRTAAVEDLTGVILIAPPFRPVDLVLADRAAALLGHAASPSELADLDEPFAARAAGYRSLDLPSVLKAVAEPVAIFQGFKDFEISWRADGKPMADAFPKKQAKLFAYEFVDHLLKQESGTSTPARYADAGRRIDEVVMQDLIGWMTEKATRAP